MKLWVLMENTACREDLAKEHGLSLYLQTGERHILFDAGQSGAFADNARAMGVDLERVDTAVLSHGHYDHGGGLMRFLEENGKAPVYVSALAFGGHYHEARYIGIDAGLKTSPRVIPLEGPRTLDAGITILPAVPGESPRSGLSVLREDVLEEDTFLHEQYLLVEEKGKRILISGCSHRGIVNIAEHFRPDVLIGGFHLVNLDPAGNRGELDAIARRLLALPTVYYTGHCTGQPQFEYLKTRMGDRLQSLSTGKTLEV